MTITGRYGGGNTNRSRIPLGWFYGHTCVMPWEAETEAAGHGVDHTAIFSHLTTFMALQEDVQCRYSLACNRSQTINV